MPRVLFMLRTNILYDLQEVILVHDSRINTRYLKFCISILTGFNLSINLLSTTNLITKLNTKKPRLFQVVGLCAIKIQFIDISIDRVAAAVRMHLPPAPAVSCHKNSLSIKFSVFVTTIYGYTARGLIGFYLNRAEVLRIINSLFYN